MSKRCELQKEYYQKHGNYKGNGKYSDSYVKWLEDTILEIRNEIIIMKNKQTSVEWLVNVVQSCIAPDYIPKEIIEQAKEMEKQQICDSHNNGFSEGTVFGVNTNYKYKTAKQYYNENYEK